MLANRQGWSRKRRVPELSRVAEVFRVDISAAGIIYFTPAIFRGRQKEQHKEDSVMKKAMLVVSAASLYLIFLVFAGCGGNDTPLLVAADKTPDAFSFTPQSGVALSTPVTSDPITVAGISSAAPVTITGGTYSIDGGTFTSAAGTVTNGQAVSVRHTSSAVPSTATNTTLTIGGVSATFTSTTVGPVAVDTTPNPFSFTTQTGVPTNTVIFSNTTTVTGINSPAVISVTNGAYSVGGAPFTFLNGTVSNGQTVTVQHTSAATTSTVTTTTLTIGGVSGSFTSTTSSPVTGQLVYDTNCASCHVLGTYDTVDTATDADLGGWGDLLTGPLAPPPGPFFPVPGTPGHQGITLSAFEIAVLAAFIDLF
jgi:hypothetical protein